MTVVIEAPMSFTGSAKRAWKLTKIETAWAKPLVIIGVISLIAIWWMLIAGWYVIFGIILVPYRLIRRSGRKQKLAQARHDEMLQAIRERS